MDRRLAILPMTLLVIALHACTTPDVRTDFDATKDFKTFHTYAFTGLTDLSKNGILNNSLTRNRIESVIAQQLAKKGLRQVPLDQNPDLLVHYWIGVKEKQELVSSGPTVGAYRYGSGAGYSSVTSIDYKEGTLIVDLIEPPKNELIWRSMIVSQLEDSSQENMELANKGVAKAFENYPPSKPAR
jgi:Domain of unknown function (DUF4136)